MKLRRRLRYLAAVVFLVVVVALFTDLPGTQLIPGLPVIRLHRVREFSTSSITLESMRELYAFTTVRYVHRAVFPYDYLPPGVSLNEILRKMRGTSSLTRDTLTEEENLFWSTYRLVNEINLSESGGTYDFVVVTLVITAGFDLSSGSEEIVVEQISRNGAEGRRAIVTLAPATIVDVAVEDIQRDDYPYPDIALGADAWRRVAEYVRERSVADEVIDEILETARRNGELFIHGVLTEAGFTEVRFIGSGDSTGNS